MKVLCHHIYEYKKGLRNLVLHTMQAEDLEEAKSKLDRHSIESFIQQVSPKKINIFFGKKECIDIIRSFGNKTLNIYTPEEDFILGILLGSDRIQHCTSYLDTKSHHQTLKLNQIHSLVTDSAISLIFSFL